MIDQVVPAAALVLEVGCGRSPHPRAGVGLDRDPVAVAAVAGVVCVCGDARQLPARDGCFDVVLARGVLHHLEDLSTFVGEARRVSRDGGLLVVLDAEPMPVADYAEMVRQLSETATPAEPTNGVDPELLRSLVMTAGAKTVHSRRAGRWTHATPPFTQRLFSSTATLHVVRWERE